MFWVNGISKFSNLEEKKLVEIVLSEIQQAKSGHVKLKRAHGSVVSHCLRTFLTLYLYRGS